MDVVVVGAGVAGSAIADATGAQGRSVLVLERDEVYVDRVHGEGMVQWGYEAAAELGVIDAIVDAPGASFMTRLVAYDELVPIEAARARSVDLGGILPGVPGLVSIGHPELRDAVSGVALAEGATVLRGVSDVGVLPGDSPVVTFEHDGRRHRAVCRLVVGADGKESVTRRSLGIEARLHDPAGHAHRDARRRRWGVGPRRGHDRGARRRSVVRVPAQGGAAPLHGAPAGARSGWSAPTGTAGCSTPSVSRRSRTPTSSARPRRSDRAPASP